MFKALTFLFLCLLFFACTKPQPLPPPPEEEPTEEPEPEKKDSILEVYYAPKTFGNSRTTHYLGSDVTPAMFLGSVWHLKDTSDNVYWEPLTYNLPAIDMVMYSTRLFVDSETVRPSYQTMLNFAKKHTVNGQSNSAAFQRSTFTDYAEILKWVPNTEDAAHFLQLAAVADSTVIRKPTGVVLRTEAVDFSFAVDFQYAYEDIQAHVAPIQATGQSPYMIIEVSYGKHAIMMAESDSAYAQVHTALGKLLENKALSTTDEQVLAASRVLAYLRAGGKEAFIQQATGLSAITSLARAYQTAWAREDNLYDYPLYYIAASLADFRLLRYNYSFGYLQPEKRWVVK